MIDIPRIVIAGTGSGSGKTTTAMALTRLFRNKGLIVQPFKCGPDYLDPTYLERAAGRTCHNLDGWMMGKNAVLSTFQRASADADLAIIEGVMGLFDGASPDSEEGSTAEIAKWLRAPVVLMIDASGMARTISAHAMGFRDYDPDITYAGIIANRVGSRRHLDLLRESNPAIPVIGAFPKNAAGALPSRHLGLVTASKRTLPDELIEEWAGVAGEWINIEALRERAGETNPLPQIEINEKTALAACRIGYASDAAFHFYYEDNLASLRGAGAELVPFSPVSDQKIPAVDVLYFGGGYPEIYAAELSANRSMIESVRKFAESGGRVYAECGGLMYLMNGIRTLDGELHAMTGIFPGECVMKDKLEAIGYVEVETSRAGVTGPSGTKFRGHEFRYSEILGMPDSVERIYSVTKRRNAARYAEGYAKKNVLASYIHAHWASNREIPFAVADPFCNRGGG